MSEVIEINDLRTLSSYRLVWDSLLADTPNATFFHTYDWFEQYWRHCGVGQRMRVLIARSLGDTLGILPLCLRRRSHKLGRVRVLTYPLDDWGTFYSPIGKNQSATLLACMRHLAHTPRDWEELDLPWVDIDSTDHGRTTRAMQQAGLPPHCERYANSSSIEFDSVVNWNQYLSGLSRKVRHELRRSVRRVEDWGPVEFIRHRPDARRAGDGQPRWDLFDEAEVVAQHSWQSDSVNGNTLGDPRLAGFYRDTYAAAARLGMSDLVVLKLSGRSVAFWLGYHYQGRVTGLRMGYRTDAPVGGVGTILLARLIEDSIARGDAVLDLGPGKEKYKHRLRTRSTTSYRLTHIPLAAWKPRLLHTTRWLQSCLRVPNTQPY